jgi:hypothetical protein
LLPVRQGAKREQSEAEACTQVQGLHGM